MRFVIISVLISGHYLLSQNCTQCSAEMVSNVPPNPINIPANGVVANTENIVFKGEESVVISPIGQDGFVASASGSNYFLAMVSPSIFGELKDKLDASFVLTINKVLKFKYTELYKFGQNLDFKIYNYKHELITIPLNYQVKNLGANFFEIDLSSTSASTIDLLDERNYYILEVKNSKNEIKLLRFKVN